MVDYTMLTSIDLYILSTSSPLHCKYYISIQADTAIYLRTHSHEHERLIRRSSDLANLPYFGGRDGENCRRTALQEWEDSVGTSIQIGDEDVKYEALQSVMSSDLYKLARSRCSAEIEIYNRASGVVCSLESEQKYDVAYAQAWMGGAYFLDGQYDLATMFEYMSNFTELGSYVSCLPECQIGRDGCMELQPWLTYYGKISVEQYCTLKWGDIDEAYMALKVCAAKAIGNPDQNTSMSKEEYVEVIQKQQWQNSKCTYDYCAKTELFVGL